MVLIDGSSLEIRGPFDREPSEDRFRIWSMFGEKLIHNFVYGLYRKWF